MPLDGKPLDGDTFAGWGVAEIETGKGPAKPVNVGSGVVFRRLREPAGEPIEGGVKRRPELDRLRHKELDPF